MEEFEKELTHLINRHSIENVADMPDCLLAGMICRMIEAVGTGIKKTLDWHGCNSVCHPSPNDKADWPAPAGTVGRIVGLPAGEYSVLAELLDAIYAQPLVPLALDAVIKARFELKRISDKANKAHFSEVRDSERRIK